MTPLYSHSQPALSALNPAAPRAILTLHLALPSTPYPPSQPVPVATVSGAAQCITVAGDDLHLGGDHHLSPSAWMASGGGRRFSSPLLPLLRGTHPTGYKALRDIAALPYTHPPRRVLSDHPRPYRVARPRSVARYEISKWMASWQRWQFSGSGDGGWAIGGLVGGVVAVFMFASILLIN